MVAAVATIVVPVLLDAVVLAGPQMQNPAWLPHAKLHAAISFLTAIALGGGALACLLGRPITDRFSMTVGAFLATAFEVSLIAAGLWPGASYRFDGDPLYGNDPQPHPLGLNIPPNVFAALVVIAVAAVGLTLVLSASTERARHPPTQAGGDNPQAPQPCP